MRGNLRRVLFVLGLIAMWVVASSIADHFLFPGPWDVARSIANGIQDGQLPRAFLRSMERLLLGYGLSLVAGIALGLCLARWEALRETVGALVLGLQAIPSVCWMPVALLTFGLSEMAI